MKPLVNKFYFFIFKNKGQSKIYLWIIGILLFIGIIGGIWVSGVYKPLATSVSCMGTILSIDTAYESTTSELGKPVFRVLTVANLGGECLQIIWDKAKLESYLQGKTVEKSIYGSIVNHYQKQKYFLMTGNDVFLFRKGLYSRFIEVCSEANCREKGFPTTEKAITGLTQCMCIYKEPYGNIGDFTGAFDKDFDVEFSITDLGSTHINAGQQSARISDKVFIKWSGDLFAGTWLGTPNYDLLYRNGVWQVIKNGAYNEISTKYYDMLNCLNNLPYPATESQVDSCISDYNNQLQSITSDKKAEFLSTYAAQVKDFTFSGNNMIVDLKAYTTYPVFTIDIDAAWLGIHKQIGMPKVSCPTERLIFNSGDFKDVVISIQNIAQTIGDFAFSIICTQGGIGTIQGNERELVAPYQSIQKTVSITATAPEKDISGKCTFRAYDINEPTNEDICSFDYTATYTATCYPGKTYCQGDYLLTCNQDGKTYTRLQCPLGCESKGGVAQCRTLAECSPGEKKCIGYDLFTCNPDGKTWSRESCPFGCEYSMTAAGIIAKCRTPSMWQRITGFLTEYWWATLIVTAMILGLAYYFIWRRYK